MKLNRILILLFLVFCFTHSIEQMYAQQQIFFADVSIYTENGKYYLSGTRAGDPLGFKLLESENLTDWHFPTNIPTGLILGVSQNVYGTTKFFAPQILKDNNMYYLTYSADEHIAIAKSSVLTGPYTQTVVEEIDPTRKSIDSDVFKDDDGKYYMYHVRFSNLGNRIWVDEFDITQGKMSGNPIQCLTTDEGTWETDNSNWDKPIIYFGSVMEGPSVIKYKGIYYMFYSANSYKFKDYAVGYATASSPLGPWTKYANNPIISRHSVKENGTGHGDFFIANDGKPYYVYHVHFSETVALPRRTRIVPLHFELNSFTGIYNISVDSNEVIIPKITSQINALKNTTVSSNIQLYPNPATTFITVVKSNAETNLESIYNIIGCQVLKLDNEKNQIDISGLRTGVYFLKSNNRGKIENTIFVKN